jgi:hypothetical protein
MFELKLLDVRCPSITLPRKLGSIHRTSAKSFVGDARFRPASHIEFARHLLMRPRYRSLLTTLGIREMRPARNPATDDELWPLLLILARIAERVARSSENKMDIGLSIPVIKRPGRQK